MADVALIGLDVGTTGTKAVAFDPDDRQLAAAIVPTPTTWHVDGQAEHDPLALWHAAVAALRDVVEQLERLAVEPIAIACTSMAEAGVPVDAHGEPTYPFIPWFDYRTQPQIDAWAANVGVEATAAISGVVLHPMFGMAKLLWIRDNEPAAYAASERWLNVADWITYQLCGSMSTDFSLASRTMVLDLARRRWSDELVDGIGIRRSLLAELVPAGTGVGAVTAEAAAMTGLPAGMTVARGGQDHVCAAFGVGIVDPGMILDSIGTAEAFFAVRSEPDMTGRLWPDELNQGVHVVPDLYYVMTGTGDGAGRIDTHREALGIDFDSYIAAAAHPGPERDMIESLAVDGQALFEKMAWATDDDVRHIATGGGTRIELLMERKRAIGGRPIEVPAIAEATCLGAARLAAMALLP